MAIPDRLTTPITIWCRWGPPDGVNYSLRRVLQRCSWRERDISTALTTGVVLTHPVAIRVFSDTSGLVYIPPDEWYAKEQNELDGFWTCDLSLSAKPPLVRGENLQEFESGTSASVTTQENNYLRGIAGAVRAEQLNDNTRGMHGPHILIMVG